VADVDVLRFLITGDIKGLEKALQEADQATNTAAQRIATHATGISNAFSKSFSVKHKSLIDGVNSSIVSMAGSFIPLGGNSRLASVALGQISGLLFSLGGSIAAGAVALGALATVMLFSRDRAKELSEALNTNAILLEKFASRVGPDSARAYGLIIQKLADINRLLKENEDPKQKELSFWESINIRIGRASLSLGSYVERQKKLTEDILKLKVAQEDLSKINLAVIPGLAGSRSSAEMHKQAVEQAKILADAQKKAADEVGLYSYQVFLDVWEKEKKKLQEAAQLQKQLAEEEAHKREVGFQSLISNAHRLASEFGRFMSEAVANFVHNAIQGIADIRDNLRLLKEGGIGAAAGGVGLIGTGISILSSIAGLFSGGAKAISQSNHDVIRAIQDWINNMRSQTKRELGASQADVAEIRRKFLRGDYTFGLAGNPNASAAEVANRIGGAWGDQLKAVAGLFEQQFGHGGTFDEVLNFWMQLLQEQKSIFGAALDAVKTTDQAKKFLQEQKGLDLNRGRQFIEFFSAQNKFSPEQQKALWEDLLAILQASGNLTDTDLLAIKESIRALNEATGDISVEGGRQLQITRSVAGITEGQANLVVGHLQTISSTAQMILEAIQAAIGNFVGAASAIPLAGGAMFLAGSIVINAGGTATAQQISMQLQTDLRAKGVKV